MITVPNILFVIALVIALIEIVRAQGRAYLAWGVLAVAVGLLWGSIT